MNKFGNKIPISVKYDEEYIHSVQTGEKSKFKIRNIDG